MLRHENNVCGQAIWQTGGAQARLGPST